MRESQLTGRLRLRHLMETTEAVEERMAEQRPRFERLAGNDAKTRAVSSFNLFQTPEPLAARLVALLAEGRDLGRTLEPSAGLGRIYRAVRATAPACPVTLVEICAELCAELYRSTEGDGAAKLVQADFFTCSPDRLGLFDSIAMNPPFKQGLDIKHINHARRFLAPGGRLVAICAAGPRQRAQLQPIATAWHDLPDGSFREAATNVAAAIVVFQ